MARDGQEAQMLPVQKTEEHKQWTGHSFPRDPGQPRKHKPEPDTQEPKTEDEAPILYNAKGQMIPVVYSRIVII